MGVLRFRRKCENVCLPRKFWKQDKVSIPWLQKEHGSVSKTFCNKAVYSEGLEANSANFQATSFLSPADADVTWSEFIVTSQSSANVSMH